MANNYWVDYFGVVAARKKQVLIFTLVCAIAAGVGFFFVPKTYESGLAMDVGIFSIISKMENESHQILTEPIEPVLVVRDSIASEPFMAAVIDALKLDVTPGRLKKRVKAKVNEDIRDSSLLINRQVIISAKGESPEQARAIADEVASLVIERHKRVYNQAMVNRFEYEVTLEKQITSLDGELGALKDKLAQYYSGGGGQDAALLLLLQGNILLQEEHLTRLKRELSQSQLLDKAAIKSENTRVTVPSFLPAEPDLSLKIFIAIGMVVGFIVSSGYYTAVEAMKTNVSDDGA